MPHRASGRNGITETSTALRRLDRQDWYRWACVLAITFIQVVGLWYLARPGIKANIFEQDALERAVVGLFGLVLLFAVFAAYQQILISGLRSKLATQIGMTATLEMLKPPAPSENSEAREQRQVQRYHFDQTLKISAFIRGRETSLGGWTADISDGGVGAVVPEILPPGTKATIRFHTGRDGPELEVETVVRHQRGFHHGFEFVHLSPSQLVQIREACAGAVPFVDLYDDRRSAETKERDRGAALGGMNKT